MHRWLCRLSRRNVLMLGLLGACGGPKIQEFNVAPRRVCADSSVRVSYKTRGQPHLVVVKHGGTPMDTTTYTIVAEAKGKFAYSSMDVLTFAPSAVQLLGFDTEMLGADSLIAAGELSASVWTDQVTLADVTVDSGRTLVVSHADKVGVVTTGSAGSPVWRGLPVSGAWELRSGLRPGEVPGDPDHSPPAHLYLKIGLACSAEVPQP